MRQFDEARWGDDDDPPAPVPCPDPWEPILEIITNDDDDGSISAG